MQEVTIPRPIRFKFLERAEQVCELAKVDYWEYSEVVSGLREQMEESYRAYDRVGLYKDEAEVRALEDFGRAEDVAKAHRGGLEGLYRRLLFNQRYSIQRFASPVLLCVYHGFIGAQSVSGSVTINNDNYPAILTSRWDALALLLLFAAILLSRLQRRTVGGLKLVLQIVSIALAASFFVELAREWLVSTNALFGLSFVGSPSHAVPNWTNDILAWGIFALFALELAALLPVALLTAAELFDFPGQRRSWIESRRRVYG